MGPLVFKTSGAALGAARWVRLPRVPATEDRCRPDRPRPPSVERLLAAVRPRLPPMAVRPRVTRGRPRRRRRGARPAGGRRAAHGRRRPWRQPSPSGSTASTARDAGAGPATVINATGVILHTNLGRAPWPAAAIEAASRAAGCLLAPRVRPRGRPARAALPGGRGAPDRADRRRGRARHEQQRGRARRSPSGSPAGTGVVVSRGELVEIGGGVRIPEIVRRAGARLIEVGTTNRTRAADFEAPLADGRATVVLRVHPSNFAQTGFVEAPDPVERSPRSPTRTARSSSTTWAAARCSTRPRSGWPTSRRRPSGWPPVRTSSRSAATSWSVDRRPGWSSAGPTSSPGSGKDPLARAVRPDKVTLAALAATLGPVSGRPRHDRHPRLADDRRPRPTALGRRADAIDAALPVALRPRVIGQSSWRRRSAAARCPARRSIGRARRSPGPAPPALARASPADATRPVVGRIEDGAVLLDLRTVEPADDDGSLTRGALARRAGGGRR